jgi:5-bromo-4-chloroindolyl phosphate hydrolysis protein
MDVTLLSIQQYDDLVKRIESVKLDLSKIQMDQSDPILDVPQTCKILRISRRYYQQLRDNQQIEFYQAGHKIWTKMSDIDKFLKKHYVPSLKK